MIVDREEADPVTQLDANPLYERHASAPYDPLYSAEASGRATGDALRDPRSPRWMKIIGFIAAAAFLGALVIAFVELVRFAS
jgi:hypothetical protein